MSGGGSGGSGTTQYNWNDTLAPEWKAILAGANGLNDPNGPNGAGTGAGAYHPYQGQSTGDVSRIAPLNFDQNNAIANTRMFLTDPSVGVHNSAPAINASQDMIGNTMRGAYLSPGVGSGDPFAAATNAYSGANSQPFQDVLNTGLGDMARQYQLGTDADTTRQFNLSGAFGGSAYQNAVAANENALGKQMRDYTSGMQNDQLNRSAGLEDSRLQRGSAAYQDERGRQVGLVGAGQNEQNLALQRSNALMGLGDIQRSYQQDQINQNYADWQNQQNKPYTMMDWLTGIVGRAQGGMSPNSSFTQPGYTASPYSQILGAGLLGYGLTK